ncbi:hypothetical protein GQ55_7G300900 [Panicum hallii var. hallii]|uniref:Uncharacterized protein n=1 Tax=Panicum hallii var. hallii TaxID=1504633 RepID=A0A2T7D0J6_9POAL|nr:hypothetical protein GQ55_7G300900 [Panicum hallii var. hallii]
MDQHGEKEAEDKFQDSAGQRQDDDAAAAAAEGHAEESVGPRAGYKAEESAGLLIKEVVSSGEASPAFFAHPCSLLLLLLRACAGCLGLHGYCGSSDRHPKPAAVAAPDAAAAADPSQEGEGGGEKANFLYMQEEVVTRVWAVRRPQPPGRPREGSGGNGGVHH